MDNNPVEDAVHRCGSIRRLASLMGVSDVAIGKWVRKQCVPVERLAQFCLLTNSKPEEMNPQVKDLMTTRWK